MIVGCQGHQLSLEMKQTVVLNLEASPDQSVQYEDSQVSALFESLGISKQESFVHQGNKYERHVTYAATVPSAQSAKRMIKKITTRLPQFIDDDDRQVINNVIDTKTAEVRQRRGATDIPTKALEIQINNPPAVIIIIVVIR